MNPIVVDKRAAEPPRDAVMLEYLRAMRELAEAQRQVVLRYLGEGGVDAMVLPATLALPALPAPPPLPAATNGRAHAPAEASIAAKSPLEVLVGVIGERTGYPAEMLDPDLDMEADLGIDSIKRIEILGTLSERLGLAAAEGERSQMVEELARVKTMRGIAAWLDQRAGGPAEPDADASAPALGRYVLALEPLPLAAPAPAPEGIAGKTFAITDDGRGIALALAELLAARGARARVVAIGEAVGAVDGLVHLASLAAEPAPDQSKVVFDLAKDALAAGATWLHAATAMGGAFGLAPVAVGRLPCIGIVGLLKSIAKEAPALRVRAVDVDPCADPAALAELFLSELVAGGGPVEVGYVDGVRHSVRVVPARADDSPLAPLELDELLGPDSIVLITGGGRGITARVAVALAQRFRCRLELVGRSPLPADEEPDLAACADTAALRRALLARADGRTPKQIDATIATILAARELAATLAAIASAGASAAYHAVDVRDRDAFGALVDDVYARHGRIDGVLHGAGVIEDKLLRDKTRASFDRVFDTKVNGALTLAHKLRGDVKFVVFFSSVSGAFGNRGQADYAAANDALDKLALHLDRTLPGRVLSINWGPWGGTGMISPELEREYTRRGIGLIRPDEGVSQLLDALRRPGPAQMILMRGALEGMVG